MWWEAERERELEDVQLMTSPESHGCCHDDAAAKLVMQGDFCCEHRLQPSAPLFSPVVVVVVLRLFNFFLSKSDDWLLFIWLFTLNRLVVNY